jgi:tetratricopeptide (TPR) repeat protein
MTAGGKFLDGIGSMLGTVELINQIVRVDRVDDIEHVLAAAGRINPADLLASIEDMAVWRKVQNRMHEAALLDYLLPHVRRALRPEPTGPRTVANLLAAVAARPDPVARFRAIRDEPALHGPEAVDAARALARSGSGRQPLLYALVAMVAGTDDDRVDSRLSWANALRQRGRPARALFHAERAAATATGGRFIVACATIAAVHQQGGDYAGAVRTLEAGLATVDRSAGHHLPLLQQLAGALRGMGRIRDALGHVTAALDELPPRASLDSTRYELVELRAGLHSDLGEHGYAAADHERAVELARRCDDRPMEQRASTGFAISLQAAGRLPAALRALHQIRHRAELWGNPGLVAAALNSLANAELAAGDLDAAERHFGRAAAFYADGVGRMVSEFGLGDVARDRGDPAGAAERYRAALAAVTAAEVPANTVARAMATFANRITVNNLAPDAETEAVLRDRFARATAGGHWPVRLELGLALATAARQRGDDAEANRLCRLLVDEATSRGATGDAVHARRMLARGLSERSDATPDDRQQAFDLLWLARADMVDLMTRTGDRTRQGEIVSQHISVYEALIDLLAAGGLRLPDARAADELAYDLHEEAKSRTFLAELADVPLPVPAAVPAELAEREADLLARRRRLQDGLRLLTAGARRIRLGELDVLAADIAKLYTSIAAVAPEYARLRQGRPATLAVVRDLLRREAPPGGMALVSYFCGDKGTTCFTVTSDGRLRVDRIALTSDALTDVAARLRTGFNGDPDAFPPLAPIHPRRPQRRSVAFFDAVGPALLAFLPAVGDRPLVCVVPHGPLHMLPVHALPDATGTRLAQRVAVGYAPSAGLLAYLLARPVTRPATAVVAGVAAREDPDPDAFEGDAAILRDAGWQVTELVGPDATPDATKAALAAHDIAHITCHGYADPRSPMDSGLVRAGADGRPTKFVGELSVEQRRRTVLRAGDLAAARVAVRLLTLRACSSGWHAPEHAGDEFTGLTRALLRAGAAATVAALWHVDRHSSGELLRALYRTWHGGEPLWRALWQAQRAMMDDTTSPWLNHPYHWASLVVVGDWR